MLDRGVTHLQDCFPARRVVSTQSLGLRANLPDDEIVAYASENGYLLVASNRRDFLRDAKSHVVQSSKKQYGCCRIPGMILLVPNEEIIQRRVLKGFESRLSLNGKAVSIADVHDQDLLGDDSREWQGNSVKASKVSALLTLQRLSAARN